MKMRYKSLTTAKETKPCDNHNTADIWLASFPSKPAYEHVEIEDTYDFLEYKGPRGHGTVGVRQREYPPRCFSSRDFVYERPGLAYDHGLPDRYSKLWPHEICARFDDSLQIDLQTDRRNLTAKNVCILFEVAKYSFEVVGEGRATLARHKATGGNSAWVVNNAINNVL